LLAAPMRVRDHPAAARRTTRSGTGTGGWHSGKIADHIGGSARVSQEQH